MRGTIISRETCPVCGGKFVYNGRDIHCPDHPKQRPSRSFVVRFTGGIYHNFTDFDAAEQDLNHLRREKGIRKKRFNPDDYKSARPNSFAALAVKYILRKKNELRAPEKVVAIMERALEHFGDMNLRDITGADLDDWLYELQRLDGKPMHNKTRMNYCSQLHDFWKWCLSRGTQVITLEEFPVFPKYEYELTYRKITTWKIQEDVIAKVADLYAFNPKVHLAIDMLANYTALRPDDLRRINEDSLNRATGYLSILTPTKRKNYTKRIRLHPDHIQAWEEIAARFPGLPDAPFFRHVTTIRRSKQGICFGRNFLAKAWARAAKEIGLDGVPLYPGTKHTTAHETAELLGQERAEDASGLTNKAFRRYCQVEKEGAFDVVTEVRQAKKATVTSLESKRAIK